MNALPATRSNLSFSHLHVCLKLHLWIKVIYSQNYSVSIEVSASTIRLHAIRVPHYHIIMVSSVFLMLIPYSNINYSACNIGIYEHLCPLCDISAFTFLFQFQTSVTVRGTVFAVQFTSYVFGCALAATFCHLQVNNFSILSLRSANQISCHGRQRSIGE